MHASDLRRRRARAQRLDGARAAPAAVVRALLAVQAQDLGAARLALRARGAAGAAALDAALTEERSLVVGWLGRGTLHLVASEDYPWLLALTAPPRAAMSRRRLAQEGVAPEIAERAVAVIERALAQEGALTRPELAERLAARGVPTAGQATPLLLFLAAVRGVALLGPLRAGRQALVLARDWLGAEPSVALTGAARDLALAELARRYLAGHGPATAADLAAWIGLPLRDARAGLAQVGSELVAVGGDLVGLATREPSDAPVAPRLLGAFDPYLLGWRDRSFAVPGEHARRVHPGGGILRATATDDGRVVGTWTAPRGRVALELFTPVTAPVAGALAEEASEVEGLLDDAAKIRP